MAKAKTMTMEAMLAGQRERAKTEVCSCGHIRAAHDNISFGGEIFAIGHGACVANIRRNTCACAKYTWTSKAVKA